MLSKVIHVKVKGEELLVRYRKSKNKNQETVFHVETTIANISHFVFVIQDGKAGTLLTTPEENEIRFEIMRAINSKEVGK